MLVASTAMSTAPTVLTSGCRRHRAGRDRRRSRASRYDSPAPRSDDATRTASRRRSSRQEPSAPRPRPPASRCTHVRGRGRQREWMRSDVVACCYRVRPFGAAQVFMVGYVEGVMSNQGIVSAVLFVGCIGCNSVLFGGAPPRPPANAPTRGGEASVRAGMSSEPLAERTARDIELEAHDMSSAEESMARRCPEGYVVSFVGSAPGETCSGPRNLYSSRTTGPRYGGPRSREDEAPRSSARCAPHTNVLVRYRCVAAAPPSTDEQPSGP